MFILSSNVPQGLILGAMLFLLFINGIASCVKDAKIILFADDVTFSISVLSVSDYSSLQGVATFFLMVYRNLFLTDPTEN